MPPCLCARNSSEDDLLCGGMCYRPWVSFSLAIILGSCGYYARDALSGLSTEVIADFGLNRSEYGLASTVVSIPTVFLAFAFGSLLDTFGVRRCTVVYTLILAFGGIAVAMSTIWRSFALLNVGRVAVGLGVAALLTSQKLYTRAIFPSPRAFAVAISVVSTGLHGGAFLALLLSLRIGSIVGSYKGGLWVAAAVTVFGVFANLLLLKLERNYEYDEVQRRERGIAAPYDEPSDGGEPTPVPVRNYGIHTTAFGDDDTVREMLPPGYSRMRACNAFVAASGRVWRALTGFSFGFWMLTLVATAFYGGFIVFIAFARELFEDKDLYNASPGHSSFLSASCAFFTIPFNPVIGVIANKTSTRAVNSLILGISMFTASLLWFNYIRWSPWPGVVLAGLSGAIISCVLWGVVPLLVTDTSVLGIAFGTVLSVESGVILLCGVGIGQLRDHTGNYTASLWCLIGLATVGIIAAVALRTCGMSRSAKSGFGGSDQQPSSESLVSPQALDFSSPMGDRTGSIEFTHLLHRGAPEPPQPALDHGSVRLSEGASLVGDESDGMRTPEMSLNIPEDNTDSHSPVHLEGELDSVQLKPGFK